MSSDRESAVDDLIRWLDDSPTPYHCAETARAALEAAGIGAVSSLTDLPRNGCIVDGGSIHAWRLGDGEVQEFRLLGAHTDSPNLRLRPHPDLSSAGWAGLGAEIYGGVLLNSWLDRDLGLAGRVVLSDSSVRLFRSAGPVARIPQLAIHLDREIGDRGLVLDRHQHMRPLWAMEGAVGFDRWLADLIGVGPGDIRAHEAHLFDWQPARVIGAGGEFLASGRLDNQLSCWAAVRALTDVEVPRGRGVVVSLFDHEEVGSESTTGAAAPFLGSLLRVMAGDGDRDGAANEARFLDVVRRSWSLSMDNAHAVHPNYPERHDTAHGPLVNAGPALKVNGNQRYATSVRGVAKARAVADAAGVPLQTFVSRNNIPCGSTIGPISATSLGIETIDVGAPQLSMHSAREMCGTADPGLLARFAAAFVSGD